MIINTGLIMYVDDLRDDLHVVRPCSQKILSRFLFGLGDGLYPIVGSLAAAFILIGLSSLIS
jgi:hypothetical protein